MAATDGLNLKWQANVATASLRIGAIGVCECARARVHVAWPLRRSGTHVRVAPGYCTAQHCGPLCYEYLPVRHGSPDHKVCSAAVILAMVLVKDQHIIIQSRSRQRELE